MSVVDERQYTLESKREEVQKLTALGIRMQTLADERVRATPCIESDVSK
jgi:hypothetical protein